MSLQGENAIGVPREQVPPVTNAIKANGGVAEVVFYPAEGHDFAKRENQVDALPRTVVLSYCRMARPLPENSPR